MANDPLSDVLRAVRMKGGVFLDIVMTAPWCVYSHVVAGDCAPLLRAPTQIIGYHYVTEGSMFIMAGEGAALEVKAGEIVLLPRNDPHIAASAKGLTPVDPTSFIQYNAEGGLGRIVLGGGGKPTKLVCGFLGTEDGFNPLIDALPTLIKLDVNGNQAQGLIDSSMKFAIDRLSEGQVADSGVISRLSELLFVEAVRNYAATAPREAVNWLKGIADPQIGRAIAIMHRDIAKPWKAEELASEAAMSRSAFIAKFGELIGVSPIRYLTTWRLAIGRRALRETPKTVAGIAFEVGYESEDAFSRAFKREYGVSPAKWRAREATR
jgi:AraC-like DNA-binding protein